MQGVGTLREESPAGEDLNPTLELSKLERGTVNGIDQPICNIVHYYGNSSTSIHARADIRCQIMT